MGRRASHLQLRGTIWWVRVRVPDELRPLIKKLEIRRSLMTSDATVAKQRANIERLKIDSEFNTARRRLAEQRGASVEELSSPELSEAEIWNIVAHWFVNSEKADRELSLEEFEVEEFEKDLSLWTDPQDTNHLRSLRQLADYILKSHGIAHPPHSETMRRLSALLHGAKVERFKRVITRFSMNTSLVLDPLFDNVRAAARFSSNSTVTLSELLARRKEDRARNLLSPKTKLKQEAQEQVFNEVFGANTRVISIDRDKARELLEIVARLPPNWTKRFPQMSARDVAKLDVSKVGKPMSATTADSYLAAFSSLLEFGAQGTHP